MFFTATWCPHTAAGRSPTCSRPRQTVCSTTYRLVIVQTANSSGAALYTEADYVRLGPHRAGYSSISPTGTVTALLGLRSPTAYGATGWPYFVLVGTDGKVLGRWMGEMTMSDLQAVIVTAIAKAG